MNVISRRSIFSKNCEDAVYLPRVPKSDPMGTNIGAIGKVPFITSLQASLLPCDVTGCCPVKARVG